MDDLDFRDRAAIAIASALVRNDWDGVKIADRAFEIADALEHARDRYAQLASPTPDFLVRDPASDRLTASPDLQALVRAMSPTSLARLRTKWAALPDREYAKALDDAVGSELHRSDNASR